VRAPATAASMPVAVSDGPAVSDGLMGSAAAAPELPGSVPWSRPATVVVDPPAAVDLLPVWDGPVTDHHGSGRAVDPGAASLWVLGVHGGAGASTVTALLDGAGLDADRGWPDPVFGGPRDVVLVGRVSGLGLRRLRSAARQWAAGAVPAGLRLRAAVAVAASPARPDRSLLAELDRLRRIVPAVLDLGWRADLVAAVAGPGGAVPPELRALLPPPAQPVPARPVTVVSAAPLTAVPPLFRPGRRRRR